MISITLPSIYPEACVQALRNIEQTTRGPYEVIVVSTLEVRGPNVVWIEEAERRGCAYAHHEASRYAIGDYLVPFADDHAFVDGWDEIAIKEFENRRSAPFALGLRGAHSGHVGTNFGIYYSYFPMMRREDVARVGWISPDYRLGFGDSDLAMRVWDAGGRCEFSSQGLICPTVDDHRKGDDGARAEGAGWAATDRELFLVRWAGKYGRGWPLDGIEWNIDLRPEDNAYVIDRNSIYYNDPSFLDEVVRMDGSCWKLSAATA